MFSNAYQKGLLTIFFSCGSNPLGDWYTNVENGHIKTIKDEELKSFVLELVSTNIETTYISCPQKSQKSLGIQLPFLVIVLKNLRKYFSFEITILDDYNMRRRFRISNYQSTTRIKTFYASMPISLKSGWNKIQLNLADFTRRAYKTNYAECTKVTIHANARVRRIYFCDQLYVEDELPKEYKLFVPSKEKKNKPNVNENKQDSKIVKTIMPPKKVVRKVHEQVEIDYAKPPDQKPSILTVTGTLIDTGVKTPGSENQETTFESSDVEIRNEEVSELTQLSETIATTEETIKEKEDEILDEPNTTEL